MPTEQPAVVARRVTHRRQPGPLLARVLASAAIDRAVPGQVGANLLAHWSSG